MQRIFLLGTCLGTLLLTACTDGSSLPNPTGKGAVRAINAIPGAPAISFLIEERPIEAAAYKESTSPALYDNLDYNFNFEIAFPGDGTFTRVASTPFKVEADRDHIFLLTGDVHAPTITVWNGDVRTWEGSETVFEARFSHASATLGPLDVYFDPAGTALGTNPPVASVSFGDITSPFDFAEGDYVLTVTAAGDPNTVYFVSRDTNLLPRFAHVITIFDADGNETSPVAVRSMTAVGNPLVFADVSFPPKIRFLHAALTLPAVDVYDDQPLTNRVAQDLAFKGATADIDTTPTTKTYYFTPTGSTATVLFSQEVTAPAPGTFTHVYAVGDTGAWVGTRFVPDRAVTSTSAKVRIFHGALNHDSIDVYVNDRDVPLTADDAPILANAAFSFLAPSVQLASGSYDLYITVGGTKTVLAGPYPFDVVLGDRLDLMLVDTVDPDAAEIVDVPIP